MLPPELPIAKRTSGKEALNSIYRQDGDALPIPIFLKGENRVAKVALPIDFTNEDIDRIIKVLEVNKRPE